MLEGEAGAVLPRVRAIAHQGGLPGLSDAERKTFDEFYLHQFTRLPSTMARLFRRTKVRKSVSPMRCNAGKPRLGGGLPDEELDTLSDPQFRRRLPQNISVSGRGAMSASGAAGRELAGMGLLFGVASTPGTLPIGSNPILGLGQGSSSGLANPTARYWLPISHTVAVCPIQSSERETRVTLSDDEVADIAIRIRNQSEMVAMSSEVELRELVTR